MEWAGTRLLGSDKCRTQHHKTQCFPKRDSLGLQCATLHRAASQSLHSPQTRATAAFLLSVTLVIIFQHHSVLGNRMEVLTPHPEVWLHVALDL